MNQHQIDDLLEEPHRFLDGTQRVWLHPLRIPASVASQALYAANWTAMRCLFRLRVVGLENLPARGPFIIAPNHASSLDPFAIAAALPVAIAKKTYWAGRKRAVLRNSVLRRVNRLARVIPIDRSGRALAAAAAVLQSDCNLVWFPEGTRSKTGELHEFKPGIGLLMEHFAVPAVPVALKNTFENLPPGARWPRRLLPISVRFGEPVYASQNATASPEQASEIAAAVRHEVMEAMQSSEL